MKVSVNSPSYKRPGGVDLLKYLPWCRIWVCETEAEDYQRANPGAEVVAVPVGVQGNLCRIRNYILDREFERGMDAVCLMDDDIRRIEYFEQGRRNRLPADDILDWLVRYSVLARELGARLWGVNVNRDGQSYKAFAPFSMLTYIGGPFSVHLPNPIRYDERLALKEDYDLTLQHLNRFRRVLRLNKFYYIVKQGASGTGQVGGCAGFRNVQREMELMKLLQKKWGTRIVRTDNNERNHSSRKRRRFDINPVMKVPIRGI